MCFLESPLIHSLPALITPLVMVMSGAVLISYKAVISPQHELFSSNLSVFVGSGWLFDMSEVMKCKRQPWEGWGGRVRKTLNTPALGVQREQGAPLSSHLEILPPSKSDDLLCQGSRKCHAQLHPVARDALRLFCSRSASPLLALIRPSASISISKSACAHPVLSPGHLLPLGPRDSEPRLRR